MDPYQKFAASKLRKYPEWNESSLCTKTSSCSYSYSSSNRKSIKWFSLSLYTQVVIMLDKHIEAHCWKRNCVKRHAKSIKCQKVLKTAQTVQNKQIPEYSNDSNMFRLHQSLFGKFKMLRGFAIHWAKIDGCSLLTGCFAKAKVSHKL